MFCDIYLLIFFFFSRYLNLKFWISQSHFLKNTWAKISKFRFSGKVSRLKNIVRNILRNLNFSDFSGIKFVINHLVVLIISRKIFNSNISYLKILKTYNTNDLLSLCQIVSTPRECRRINSRDNLPRDTPQDEP